MGREGGRARCWWCLLRQACWREVKRFARSAHAADRLSVRERAYRFALARAPPVDGLLRPHAIDWQRLISADTWRAALGMRSDTAQPRRLRSMRCERGCSGSVKGTPPAA